MKTKTYYVFHKQFTGQAENYTAVKASNLRDAIASHVVAGSGVYFQYKKAGRTIGKMVYSDGTSTVAFRA